MQCDFGGRKIQAHSSCVLCLPKRCEDLGILMDKLIISRLEFFFLRVHFCGNNIQPLSEYTKSAYLKTRVLLSYLCPIFPRPNSLANLCHQAPPESFSDEGISSKRGRVFLFSNNSCYLPIGHYRDQIHTFFGGLASVNLWEKEKMVGSYLRY